MMPDPDLVQSERPPERIVVHLSVEGWNETDAHAVVVHDLHLGFVEPQIDDALAEAKQRVLEDFNARRKHG